jgi:hypothetical protein
MQRCKFVEFLENGNCVLKKWSFGEKTGKVFLFEKNQVGQNLVQNSDILDQEKNAGDSSNLDLRLCCFEQRR